ncbi:CD80-like C2-set immunoglobulin domain [Nesidiocoris tenuis]|uniref:CD80-like C2-set immunoglobulin domain n=1 Tax=Nesidiocoris tenuis TaxID=355587 RepID=A0ABN7ADP2_9HEMI|nr:CD80-like C2-set immunoglobulin domain [Nesidiocoris tenuis]
METSEPWGQEINSSCVGHYERAHGMIWMRMRNSDRNRRLRPPMRSDNVDYDSRQNSIVSLDHVEAVGGGVAKLPCDITPPFKDDKVHLIIWYKDGLISPIYSVDARNLSVETGRHWSDEASMGGRAYFQFNTNPARLTIDSIKDSDSGSYRCRVDFRRSPTRNSKVNLTIILPPEQLSVLDERGEHIRHYILGPYNEGATIEIMCIATGGRPLPKVTWWQDNALLDDSFENISERKVRNVLRITQLERRHLHAILTCQASNNDYLPPISSDVKLDLNLKPLWVRILGENRPLSTNNSYEITCEVIGSRPPPTITWWKGSVQLRNTREMTTTDGNRTISTLALVPTMEDSGKYLSCRAVNNMIPESGLEDGWKLNIHHVPIVSLELGNNINASWVREGMDVYFECNIKSNPWVYRVIWKHNGKPLVNDANSGTIVSNQSLVLQNVEKSRTGSYSCVASNQVGDGESYPFHLDVKYAPVCRPGQSNVIGVGRSEIARIACEVEANPPAVKYIWKFNGSEEMSNIPKTAFTSEPNYSSLTYVPMREKEFGSLLCWGRNPLGIMKVPCIYFVTPAGRPDPLSNCSLVNQTHETLGVDCSEGFDGGLPQTFHMEVYETSHKMLIGNYTSTTPVLVVTGLPSGLLFKITLYASNEKGISDKVYIRTYTLKLPEKRTALSPEMLALVPVISVIAGVGMIALFLLGCIVLSVLRCRHKEKTASTKQLNELKQNTVAYSSDSLENPDVIPLGTEHLELDEMKIKRPISNHSAEDFELQYKDHKIMNQCTLFVEQHPTSLEPTVFAQVEGAVPHLRTSHPSSMGTTYM